MKHINFLKHILPVVAVCALVACGEKKQGDASGADVPVVTFREAPAGYSLASKFKNVRMVQLEMNDECYVGKIRGLVRTGGKLFVLTGADELFCFDEATGKFMRKIGEMGEGPGEYVVARTIFFDNTDSTICVLDSYKSAIMKYSLDGEYKSSKKMDNAALSWADRVVQAQDGSLLVSMRMSGGVPPSEYAYMTVGTDGKTGYIDEFAPISVGDFAQAFATTPMTICDEGVRFFKFLNDTIFTLKNGEAVPYMRMDLGRSMPQKDALAKMGEYSERNVLALYESGTYITRFDEIFETRGLIAVIPSFSGTTGYYWIDKEKQEGVHIMSSNVVRDELTWFLQGRSIINLAGSDDKGMISVFHEDYVNILKDMLNNNQVETLFNDELRTFFGNADADGNPCLIYYDN